jgi:uncharacterized protein (UPF0248 family)
MPQENPQEVNRFGIIRLFAEAEEGTVLPLTVTGLSMTPFLLHKISVVYLKKERGYLPRKGDIVFFARQDLAVVLHRVVGIRKDGTLIIKGDAQRWREEIRPEQILAHVTRICRSKKVFSADHKGYRFLVALWRPFRLLHPPMAYCLNFLSRIPYKLSKKPQK